MKTNLKFVVATHPGHYRAAHTLMKEGGLDKQLLGFPTVMAWDDKVLIGVIGTRIVDKMILAGPLVLKGDKRRPLTAIRLCEAYEAAMYSMGITTFIFFAEGGSFLEKGIKRYFPEATPYAYDGRGNSYYTWRVQHGRQRYAISPETEQGRESPSATAG